MKDKKTIINLAPIPCPLSLPLTCGTHASSSSSTIPLRILPQRRTRGRPVLPLRCTTAAARAPCSPLGPCRRRRRAGRPARCVLRHRPHPPPHPCSGAVARRVLRRGPRPPPRAAPSAAPMPKLPSCWPPRPCRGRHALRRTGRLQRAERGPSCRGRPSCPSACVRAVFAARGGGRSTEAEDGRRSRACSQRDRR